MNVTRLANFARNIQFHSQRIITSFFHSSSLNSESQRHESSRFHLNSSSRYYSDDSSLFSKLKSYSERVKFYDRSGPDER